MTKANTPSSFVTQLTPDKKEPLLAGLKERGFEISHPPHTHFAGKKAGVSCTLYQSGKLVVQGKGMTEFIQFFLEPEILQDFGFGYTTETDAKLDPSPRIGIDESGKGDFFGPLCIAGVFAEGSGIAELKAMGVRDSKALTDKAVGVIAKKIRAACAHHIVRINPAKYNELYASFNNLNRLLAWGHATTIEALVEQTGCRQVIVDQFAAEHVVEIALKRKKMEVSLTQRHRAEVDLVVAAASILARQAFLDGLAKLSDEFGIHLPKGASAQVKAAARQLIAKHGREVLPKVSKVHFKTSNEI